MMPSEPGPYHPWWEQLLATAVQLVAAPGWQGTLKVALLAIVIAAIYVGVRRLLV